MVIILFITDENKIDDYEESEGNYVVTTIT